MNKKIIVDCRISDKCIDFLADNNYEIIKFPSINSLDNPISSHPDMSAVKIKDTWIVYDDAKHSFDFYEKKIVVNRGVQKNKKIEYPFDIGLNCAVVGKNLICNEKYTENTVLSLARENGIKIIDVKQGYAKCSVCIVDENSIITEDLGIANKCTEHGIDVLLLKSRAVALDGYDYGFIGGCSGMLSDGRIVFSGCIENHPEYESINNFCCKHGKRPVSMSDEPLYDVGSILEA